MEIVNISELECFITNDVDDASQSSRSNGDGDGAARVPDGITSHQTLSTIHSNGTHSVLSCKIQTRYNTS